MSIAFKDAELILENHIAFIKYVSRNHITVCLDGEEYDIPVCWDN